jgi:hypothetical protein
MKRFLTAIVLTASLVTGSCAHVQPVISCLEKLAGPVLNAAVAQIYQVIEAGIGSGQTEVVILASLETLAIKFAPDVWACAMHFVSAPDAGPTELKALAHANASDAAAIAADYLNSHADVKSCH